MNSLNSIGRTCFLLLLASLSSCKEPKKVAVTRSVADPAEAAAAAVASREAGKRVALLIGNNIYEPQKSEGEGLNLFNAERDAKAVAQMLVAQLGFGKENVFVACNVTRQNTFELLEKFKKSAEGAELVLVFYAGHGMESLDGRENFLLPVDVPVVAVAASDASLRANGISLTEVLKQMGRSTPQGAKVALLDCCRQRPAGRNLASQPGGGLAEVREEELPDNTLVLLAAAPGRIASDGTSNGPFTQALLEKLPTPGTSLLQGFYDVSDRVEQLTQERQQPWLKMDGSGRAFRELVLTDPAGMGPRPAARTDLQNRAKLRQTMLAMENDYAAAGSLGTLQGWLDFEKGYRDMENPYSERDEEMLHSVKPKMRRLEMLLDFDRALLLDDAGFWKTFLEKYKNDTATDTRDYLDSAARYYKDIGLYQAPSYYSSWGSEISKTKSLIPKEKKDNAPVK